MPNAFAPRGAIEKPKDRKKVLRRLWSYLGRYKWMVATALVLTVTSNFFALIGPKLSGEAIDAIGSAPGEADFPAVFYYCFLMLVFYLQASGKFIPWQVVTISTDGKILD